MCRLINFADSAKNINMAYFNYHAKVKNLIKNGHCTKAVFKHEYNGISPALVLFFDNCKPMPIRFYRFEEYSKILSDAKIVCKSELKNANLIKKQ